MVHFYHLHALDWVDVVSALKADPKKTSELAQIAVAVAEELAGLLLGPAEAAHQLRRERPAGDLRERLLGPHRLQAAARSEPDWRGALSRGARVAEGDRQGPHDLRRQKSAPELPGRRRALLDQHRRGECHQRRTAGAGRQAVRRRADFIEQVYIPDLLAIAAFYKDWARHRRRARELHVLRRPADQGLQRSSELQVPARRHPQSQPERSAAGQSKDPQEVQEFIPHSWYEYGWRRRGPAPLGR